MNQNGQSLGRINVLDSMRGITLLFIFLCNIPALIFMIGNEDIKEFDDNPIVEDVVVVNDIEKVVYADGSKEILDDMKSDEDGKKVDYIPEITAGSIIGILFSDSSRPLFAFMFGISAVLMYDLLRKRQAKPISVLLRRMLTLALFGALHLFFIWSGDILFTYAIGGFLLLLFIKLPQKWLLTVGLLFFTYAVAGFWIEDLTGVPVSIGTGMYDLLPESTPDFLYSMIASLDGALSHLGFMLLGMYAYRAGMFTQLPHKRLFLWITSSILLVIGIAGKAIDFMVLFDFSMPWVISGIANATVTAGYIFLFLAIGTSEKVVRLLLVPFQSVGRMAFTNYLTQSLIFWTAAIAINKIPFFSNLTFISDISELQLYGLALAIFLLQMICSHFWLKRFVYGPLEWIWRLGTYWKFVPIRRRVAVGEIGEKASGM
ncbi:DUF418 domain-containing protein [Shouchella lonarensis]|uniref:DUF418 domain-containing protein n=1 Tax=Shouchella lonarensis TaxID=1464122 RepID=A0A1G6GIL2_9BACI|nr:DUF418 domain-containing protein [Shouchella lonarensis]SDB81673.1 uncharacterized protein SAMN05421737_10197 [Shouchella lonarensis]